MQILYAAPVEKETTDYTDFTDRANRDF